MSCKVDFNWYILGFFSMIVALGAKAQSVPPLVNYQGKLTTKAGTPLPGGFYGIQFRIWDDPIATNSTDLIWDQQQVVAVQTNGVFDVILGSPIGTQISGMTPMANSLSLAFTQINRFFGLTVIASNSIPVPNADEILPRQQVLTVPYAISAGTAMTAVNAINGVPAGTVLPFAGAVTPSGFLVCDGSAYSSGVYSNLYAAISTLWGSGNGTNNFNVPDFRGRTLFGTGVGGVDMNGHPLSPRAIAQTGGEESHMLAITEMPPHSHTYAVANQGYSDNHDTPTWAASGHYSITGNPSTSSVGGGAPHNTMPPFAVVNYIIKY